MRVCNCVTRSTSNDNDEDVANLYGLRKQAERKKTMTKKLKVRVSALIMCAAMLATSMVVFAASKTETVGLDTTTNGKAFVEIYSSGLYARATTSGVSLYNDILYTSITGNGPDPREATGYSSIDVIPETKAFTSATSTHKWTSRSHTMTVYP